MKLKKFVIISIVILSIVSSTVRSNAVNSVDLLAEDPKLMQTKDLFIKLTRPSENELTNKYSTVICGVSESNFEDITVNLYYFDRNERKYLPLKNEDNQNRWCIGSIGIFLKEVKLKYKGLNNLRLFVHRASDTSKLKVGENLQILDIQIYVDPDVRDLRIKKPN